MYKKNIFVLLLFSFLFHSLFGQVIDTTQFVLSDKVLFDFGKYELTTAADSTIHQIATRITNLKNYEIKITAHTDAIGSNQNNMILSQNRAQAVSEILIQKGIPTETISTHIFGEENPETDNETELGRQLNRRVTIDVFKKIKLLSLKGNITDADTGEKIQADVVIRTKTNKDSIQTDTAGNFLTYLPLGTVGGIDIYAKGYFFETQMFKVTPTTKGFFIQLKKTAIGAKVDIKNLYYKGNQAVLLSRSMPELPKLLKFMELNDSLKIEIAGHINRPNHPPVDKLSWDYKLSIKRAKMVYDYLLENNISADRVSYKGYGNRYMRFPRARSEREQALNRRVEIVIIGKT